MPRLVGSVGDPGGCGEPEGPKSGPAGGAGVSRGPHSVTSLRLQGGVCSFLFLEAVMLSGCIEGSILAALTASSKAVWLLGYRPFL